MWLNHRLRMLFLKVHSWTERLQMPCRIGECCKMEGTFCLPACLCKGDILKHGCDKAVQHCITVGMACRRWYSAGEHVMILSLLC